MTSTPAPRLLLVHAHPDDETLWTGGTIARYAGAEVEVTLVTCTLGEQGEVIPPELVGLDVDHADQLGGYRFTELRQACAVLGVHTQHYLGGVGRWRDSGMAGTDANRHPRAFVAGDLGEQVDALVGVLEQVRPQVVVTYGPDGGYGHPDHIRAHEVTMAATAAVADVSRVFYTVASRAALDAGVADLSRLAGLPYALPAPGELPAVDDALISTVVPVDAHLSAKLAAMRAHATQVSVWQGEGGARCYALSNGVAQPVLPDECYVLARGDHAAGSDLFGER